MALHSGKVSTVKVRPHLAGGGRCFEFQSHFVPASIDHVEESPLCTTLSKDGYRVRTVEHLLSALEATGVDNCLIEVVSLDAGDRDVEVRAVMFELVLINKVFLLSLSILHFVVHLTGEF